MNQIFSNLSKYFLIYSNIFTLRYRGEPGWDAGDPGQHPAAPGVGGGGEAVAPVGQLHPRHQAGRDEPAGAAGPEAAAETGQGDRDMSGELWAVTLSLTSLLSRSDESCTLSALMSWSDSRPSTARREVSSYWGSGTSSGWLSMLTRLPR